MNGFPAPIAQRLRSWLMVILAIAPATVTQFIATAPALVAQQPASTKAIDDGPRTSTAELGRADAALASQKAVFIENKGQWDRRARFLLQTGGMNTWITDRGVVYDLYRSETAPDAKGTAGLASANHRRDDMPLGAIDKGAPPSDQRRIGHIIRVSFDGATARPTAVRGTERIEGNYNYFLGTDSRRWATDVARYAGARIERLYQGVDAVFYVDDGRPRYDLVIAPGADPSRIAMRIEGADGIAVTTSGSLNIATTMGALEQRELYAYQQANGRKQQVRCAFEKRSDGSVGFAVGAYDRGRPLVIDPLVYSTFMGGYDWDGGMGIAVDAAGSTYITGSTPSGDFPTTGGAYDVSLNNYDVFLTKLNAAGNALVYSTFIGGSGQEFPYDIAIDESGNAYVTGYAYTDYPTTVGAFDITHNGGDDIFVTKLTAAGNSLSYSTYLGGSSIDWGLDIAVDNGGNAYVTGFTMSSAFPTTGGAFDVLFNGGTDVFVAKVNAAGSTLLYSTYVGGSNDDWGFGIAVDGSGCAFLTGYTLSTNYPASVGAFDISHNGSNDVFVTKLNESGSALAFSSYLGGSSADWGSDIAVDLNGYAYVTGMTASPDYPATGGVVTGYDYQVFVSKLAADGSGLLYSPCFGGSGDDEAKAIAIGPSGKAFVTGYTYSTDFPTTADAIDRSLNGSYDGFVTWLNDIGSSLEYSTYIGGTDGEISYGIAVDGTGSAYVTGYTYSTDLPTTSGALDVSHNGVSDAFVSKFGGGSTVTITAPNGGEAWCAGAARNISWSSSGVTNVKLELSNDGGATWPTIIVASTVASSGSYSWLIPEEMAPASSYRIRISDAANASIADVSNAAFSINTPPTVTLQPESNTPICPGTSVMFSTEVAGSPAPAIRWQTSIDGLSFEDIPGESSTTLTIASPTLSMNGTYYRVRATNVCSEVVSTAAQLRVVDDAPPVPDVVDLAMVLGECSATIVGTPTATDACVGTVMGTTTEPLIYTEQGTYIVHWVFDDGYGNVSTQEQIVIVDDQTAPVPDVAEVLGITGSCSATIPSAPTATDDCVGTIIGSTDDPLTYNAQGTYIVLWTFDDGNGNVSTQDQTVVVDDLTAPVPDAAEVLGISGSCSAQVTSAPTATDACTGTIIGTTVDPLIYTEQGTYVVHWVFDDGYGNVSTQEQTVVVDDQTAPVPDVAEALAISGACGATITSAPTATDACVGTIVGTTDDPWTYDAQGTYIVHWTFDDGHGNTSSQEQTVVVADNEPPTISVALDPTTLWPANHTMRPITATVTPNDNCAGVSYVLTSITSSEADDGLGDGDYAGDIQDAAYGTADMEFALRAERLGNGTGRVYTITYTVTDAGLNDVTGTATVSVPHSSGKPVTGSDQLVLRHLGFASRSVPNPLAKQTRIEYHLATATYVTVRVHDGRGRIVASLANTVQAAGPQSVDWSALDETGRPLPAGLYFYTIEADGTSETGRMVLVR